MSIYNCKHAGDLYRITKFDSDANVESSYLTDGTECDCPAGVRPRCRHRTMLPLFKASKATNGEAFYDYDREVWLASEAEVEFEDTTHIIAEIANEIAPEPTPSPKSDLRRI